MNPVWKRYIIYSMPKWLQWLANNHIKSHIQLLEKYMVANPYYVPDIEHLENRPDDFLIGLIYDEDFLKSLSDKGLSVWYYSNFIDFLDNLEPFTKKNKDLFYLYNALRKNIWWYDRVYSSLRSQLANKFETEGRRFRE